MKVLFLSLTILSFLGPCISNAWSWERKRPMRQYDYRSDSIDQFKSRQQQLKYTKHPPALVMKLPRATWVTKTCRIEEERFWLPTWIFLKNLPLKQSSLH